MNEKLEIAWKKRLELYAEGSKFYAEGSKFYAEGSKFYVEGDKFYAEGAKLYAEGSKLRAEGDKLHTEGNIHFLTAVIEVYGNIKIEWKNWNDDKKSYECHLDNGEVFVP